MGELIKLINTVIKKYGNLETALKNVPELKSFINNIPGLKNYILENDEFWKYTVSPMTKKVREGILEGTVDSSGVARMNGKIQEIYKIIPAIQDKVKDSFPHYSEASSTVKAASSVGLTVSTISVIGAVAVGVYYLNYKINKMSEKNSNEIKNGFQEIKEILEHVMSSQWNYSVYGPFKGVLDNLKSHIRNRKQDGIEIDLNELRKIKAQAIEQCKASLTPKDLDSFLKHLNEFRKNLFVAFVCMHNIINCLLALSRFEEAADTLNEIKKEFHNLKESYNNLFKGDSAYLSTIDLAYIDPIAEVKTGINEMYETLIDKNLLIAQLSVLDLPYFDYELSSERLLNTHAI